MLLVHYANLIDDKPNEIARIANFLNLELTPSKLDMILQHSSLEYMKANHQKFEMVGRFQPKRFFNKGTNARWKDLLTDEQLQHYEHVISNKLEPECANWVKNGRLLPPLPRIG